MMAGGWDRSGNVAMETSKGSSHNDFFSSWGKNPSLSFLPVCLPEWQNQNLEHSLSQVPFHPGLCWPDMQARDQEGSEFSKANVCCLWGTIPHSNHWLHEGENGKTWDALKTGSEMLWAPVCGSLLGFWDHNSTWDAPSPPAEGSRCGRSLDGYINSITEWDGTAFTVPKSPATPSWQAFYNFSWNSFLFKSHVSVF